MPRGLIQYRDASGQFLKGWNADVFVGKSIRIFGNNRGSQYDLTFEIGDEAVYGSYNLIYTGEIISITEKNVIVKDMDRRFKMGIDEFIARNWNFDSEYIADENRFNEHYL